MDTLILVLEIIGTVAFAVSGALTGIKRGMDLFGVMILGVATAVGGGAIRDVLIGITPPAMLTDPSYTLLSAGVSVLMFIVCTSRFFQRMQRPFEQALFVSDSLGLGCFSVYGVSVAYSAQPESGLFLAVFLGVITGVGGGVLRDMFAGNLPYIFTKHIYAWSSPGISYSAKLSGPRASAACSMSALAAAMASAGERSSYTSSYSHRSSPDGVWRLS